MARKWPVFFYGVQSLLGSSSWGGAQHHMPLLMLLTLSWGLKALPAFAAVPPEAPRVQGSLTLPDKANSIAPKRAPLPLPSLVQQGREFYEAGQFSDAVTIWQQAAQAYQAQGSLLNKAGVLSNLSLAYQQLGQWSQATQAIAESLRLLQGEDTGNSQDQLKIRAQALNTQGSLQLAQGQAEQALATWQKATTTYAQANDHAGINRSRINQAQALQTLGLYRRALTTLNQVNQTLQKQPNPIKAAGLRSLSNALRTIGDLDQSRQVSQESLVVAQQLHSPQDISAALFSLGNIAQAQGDAKAALEFYQQSVATSSLDSIRVQAQLAQLNLLLDTQQWSAAQALSPQIQALIVNLPPSRTAVYARIDFAQSLSRLQQNTQTSIPSWLKIAQLAATAVQQAKDLGDQRAEAYALGNLGGLYEKAQQWPEAQALTQKALLLAQAINAPDITYQWQWQLGRLLKAQENTQGAITAYAGAVNTLQSLRSDLVAMNPEVQFSFRERVEPVYRQLVQLLLESGGTETRQENLKQARNVIESLQLAELDNFFRAACVDATPVLIDQVVDQNDRTAAVIYPIMLADRLEVILKLPQQQNLRHYTAHISQHKLENTLEQLRGNLEKPYTSSEGKLASQQVYNWLIRPAEADLSQSQIKTLVFVLDGSLRNVPMAALHDGKQYLVEKYGVALTPGLQLLDPKPLMQRPLEALTAGLTKAHQGFPALDYVDLELAQIRSKVPSRVLLNQKFTSIALQNQLNTLSFPVVHLATHGQFSSQADKTFILAWDKRINVNELSHLFQNRGQRRSDTIELLVLSACETAVGDKRAALGLAGVAVRAGARSTLASLWHLDDQSSALLVSQFYQELAKPNVTKAEALRRAQLALLKDPSYRQPVHWAPFVLVGNWL